MVNAASNVSAAAKRRVVALVHPPQSTFELACAAEVFGIRRPNVATRYSFSVCTHRPGLVATLAGFDMAVSKGLSALKTADTIVIPGWQTPDVPVAPAVLDALRTAHAAGTRILAICSGAFVLAEAGLVDGRRVATHWRLAATLAARFPAVDVDPDVLYVDHGDVATSAGTAAGIDLCLHVVRSDHGAAYASEIARHMVMPPRREGGQRQFASPAPPRRADGSLAPVLDWVTGQLDAQITIEDMAAYAVMSPRTFVRHFHSQVGTSPGRWLLMERISAARVLLEQTDLPIEAVATRIGLSSATNLRRHFQRHVRTTPGAYRSTFHQADRNTAAEGSARA